MANYRAIFARDGDKAGVAGCCRATTGSAMGRLAHWPDCATRRVGVRNIVDLAACSLLALSAIAPAMSAAALDWITAGFLDVTKLPPAFHRYPRATRTVIAVAGESASGKSVTAIDLVPAMTAAFNAKVRTAANEQRHRETQGRFRSYSVFAVLRLCISCDRAAPLLFSFAAVQFCGARSALAIGSCSAPQLTSPARGSRVPAR